MSILIFVPDSNHDPNDTDGAPGLNVLRSVGCSGLGEELPPAVKHIPKGPDDGPGSLLCWLSAASLTRHRYDENKARQRWEKCKPAPDREAGAFWLGQDLEFDFDPASLFRGEQQWNHNEVVLSDGNPWLVPVVLTFPTIWGLDEETGEPRRKIAEEFAEFCGMVEQFFQIAESQEANPDISQAEEWRFCCDALALNYRINQDVIDFLGILGDDSIAKVVEGVMNIAQKKNSNLNADLRMFKHVLFCKGLLPDHKLTYFDRWLFSNKISPLNRD